MTNKTKIPKLRFKEFSWEWREVRLGEVCIKGTSNISANTLENNNWDFKIYWATWVLKNIDFYDEKDNYLAIVKDWAGVWRLLYCEWKSSTLWTLDKLKPKKWIILYFLFTLLKNINFWKYVVWSTIPHIYFKDYKKEKLKLPSTLEQNKIASFLSSLDEKIENIKEKRKALLKYKKWIMQKIFKQEIRFKDEDWKDFEGWEVMNFLDIFISIPTKNHQIYNSEILDNWNYKVVDQWKKKDSLIFK